MRKPAAPPPQATSPTTVHSIFAEAAAQLKVQFFRRERLRFTASLLLLVCSSGTFQGIRQFTREGCPTTGTVTGTEYGGWRTQVRFSLAGESIEFVQDGPLPRYRVGDRVGVFYNARDPRFARVNAWGALWALPLFTTALGASGLLLDFVITARRSKAERS